MGIASVSIENISAMKVEQRGGQTIRTLTKGHEAFCRVKTRFDEE